MASEQELVALEKEQARLALEEKKRKQQEAFGDYDTGVKGLYATDKTQTQNLLGSQKSDVEGLYNTGYSNLQNLLGDNAKYQMGENLKSTEKTLARKGLSGGPSGALNEALAGASERIYQGNIDKLSSFDANKIQALDKLYRDMGNKNIDVSERDTLRQADLFGKAFGIESDSASEIARSNTDIGMKGLEAGLGTNVIKLQQEGAQALVDKEKDVTADVEAAKVALARQNWDTNYSALKQSLYTAYRNSGLMDSQAMAQADADAKKQLGPRP